jgi:hypothetical protein
MVVLVFADADPSGYQMATSIAHKLRAYKDCEDPRLAFRVVVPALTVEQVKQLDLPHEPIKATDKRAAKWHAAMGVGQTEIDALATLQPEVLRRIVKKAVKPYWDAGLEERARKARVAWEAEAAQAFADQVNADQLAALRVQAEAALDQLRSVARQMEVATEDLGIEWPEITVIEGEAQGDGPMLVDSEMDLVEHAQILRARKRYENES